MIKKSYATISVKSIDLLCDMQLNCKTGMAEKPFFETTAIFGVGLIGGSIARILKNRNLSSKVIGVGRSGSNMGDALQLGIIDEVGNPEEAAKAADLIILCTPVLSIIPTLEAIAPYIKHGALVTDVGSTKREIVEKAESISAGRFVFIGSHPIAGTEKSGAQYSFDELFENHKCIVTPAPSTKGTKELEKLKQIWITAGMKVIEMDPARHDLIFGAISHLPHMVAFALVNAVCDIDKGENLLDYAAGGFRDVTRIASSSPEMWADVAISNSEEIMKMVTAVTGQLDNIRNAIKSGDRAKLISCFEKANKYRDRLK
jgi:prephenate dehydrogenase